MTKLVKFLSDHDHHPAPGQIIAFKAGHTLGLDDELAEQLTSAGVAAEAEPEPAPKAPSKTRVETLKDKS